MLKKMVVALAGTAMVAVMLASIPGAGAAPRTTAGSTYEPVLDPANFVSVIDNPYYPLPVGRVLVYKDEARATDTVTVTNQTKVIEGITTTVVTQMLRDNDPTVRADACSTFEHIGTRDPRAVAALIGVLHDPELSVRAAAVDYLGEIGPNGKLAISSLQDVAEHDPDTNIRAQAAQSIKSLIELSKP